MVRLGGAIATSTALILLCLTALPAQAASPPSFTVSPTAGIVGTKILVSGAGYPPDTTLSLAWETVTASWVVSGNPSQVTGMNATPVEKTISVVQTDASGSFRVNVTAPRDFGGKHVLQAVAPNGTVLQGRAIFTLEPSFKFSPTEGQAGTPIVVTALGLGYGLYSTSYHLYWDNSYVGYFTAISTSGSTNFTFYASGTPGTHYIDIYQGYPGPGYLNPQQGPPASETQSVFPPYIPFHATFTITGSGSGGALVLPGALGGASFVVLAAGLVVCGTLVTVSRNGSVRRRGVARAAVALVGVTVIAVAAVVAILVFSSAPVNTQANFVPQATVMRPAITVPQNSVTTGPRISVSPTVVSVGQNITVQGAGFSPGVQLPLTWTTRKGSNLNGYALVAEPLRNVTAASDGSFSFIMAVPSDLGGLHFIAASNLTPNSNGTLFIQRTASINATEGPAGSTVAVTMLGVGWTFDTNIAALDYDNSYLGYGCGFNSGGNVTFYLTVTGAPGVHTIDIYPSVWWGPSGPGAQLATEYRYPLLTPQDHPELMPSFHFSFLITSSGQQSQSSGDIPASVPLLSLPSVALGAMFLLNPPAPVRRSDSEVQRL
jgi:hypothetical protein